MRWTLCVIIVLLSGCQSLSLFEQPREEALPPVMSLWERYQHCLIATISDDVIAIVNEFEHVMLAAVEPPSWMKRLGRHVINQPLRSSVDPQALGAGCTLRAAALLVEADRVAEARALYHRLLSRYSDPSLAYYIDQAKARLFSLSDPTPAVVALHTDSSVHR